VENARYKSEFERDGFLLLPGVLAPEEIEALEIAVDGVLDEDRFADHHYSPFIGVRLFEADRIFEEMLTREPIISLVESILGHDCHLTCAERGAQCARSGHRLFSCRRHRDFAAT
jgi:hypothetical protein